jgi:hydroxyacylglutathione hydrolase
MCYNVTILPHTSVAPSRVYLTCRGWQLQYILNTHHHQDHVGGNRQLKQVFGCAIYGPAADKNRIPQIDKAFADGDTFKLGESEFRVFDTPGHTRGHISFWAPKAKALFPGDTLFAMGCGRLFEGTPAQMWKSLSKLKELPEDTQIFCAHEYTENNAKCVSGPSCNGPSCTALITFL